MASGSYGTSAEIVALYRERAADAYGGRPPTGWSRCSQVHSARAVILDDVPAVPPVRPIAIVTTRGRPRALAITMC